MTTIDEVRPALVPAFRRLLSEYAIAWVVVLLFLILAVTTSGFLRFENLRNLADQQSLVLIAASLATITMIAGGFDVSQAAIYITAPLVALRVENATESVALALLLGAMFGLVAGVVNGVIVAGAKINSFIATLATSLIIFGFGFIISDRSILRPASSDAFAVLARTRWLGVTTAVWVALIVVALAWFVLARTRFGRHVYAVGGNPEAARLAGVRVPWVVGATFAFSGLAAGLAGTLRASRTLSAQPSDDFSFVFTVIAAIVVGGTSIAGGEGAVWRTVLGAFFIAFMVNGFNLNRVDPIWQRIIQGAVILAAVGIDARSRSRRA